MMMRIVTFRKLHQGNGVIIRNSFVRCLSSAAVAPVDSAATTPSSSASSFLDGGESEDGQQLEQSAAIKSWTRRSLAYTNNLNDPEHLSCLVGDAALRLDRQHKLCLRLADIVEELKKTASETNNQKGLAPRRGPPPSLNGKKRVISTSAYLTPYWWNQKHENQCHEALDDAAKNVKSLEILHRDTQQLCVDAYNQMKLHQDHAMNDLRSLSMLRTMLSETMKQIHARHATTIENMADLILGLRPLSSMTLFEHNASLNQLLHPTIQVFLQGRMGVQLLCDHIVQLTKGSPNGAVTIECPVSLVLEDAVCEATHLCDAHFMTSPPIHILQKQQLTTSLIRPWFHYAAVELLKNAMAVTVEMDQRRQNESNGRLANDTICEDDYASDDDCFANTPLYITVDDYDNVIYFNIHDQGGGFDKAKKDSLFDFALCNRKWDRLEDQQTYAMTRSPLRGLGVGLCMSRMMLRHFGNDLTLLERPEPTTLQHENTEIVLEPGVTATIALNKDHDTHEAPMFYPYPE